MGDGRGAAAPGGTGRPPSRGAPAPAPGPGRLRRARIGANVRAHRLPARGAAGRDPGRDPPGRSAAGRPPDRADSVHAAVARTGLPGDRRAGPDRSLPGRAGRGFGAAVTRRLMTWGMGGGMVTGIGLLAASYVLPSLFTPDVAVQENLRAALWVLMIAQPVAEIGRAHV